MDKIEKIKQAATELKAEHPHLFASESIFLPLRFWQALDDFKFTVLYTSELTFIVPKPSITYDYIEKRRRKLNLDKNKENGKEN